MQKKRTLRLINTFVVSLVLLWTLFGNFTVVDFSTTTAAAITAADGASLYASKCSICHAKNGAGTPAWRAKGQPDLSTAEWQKTHSDEEIATRIRDGKGKMPGFGKKLSDEDIKALVRQVRTLRR
jgi:cytochrome c6